jgi:hypothetical protein
MTADVHNKLRIRSPSERLLHARGLLEAKEVLEGLGIPFLLGGGTLLGAYRDGGFIPWDWDASINVRTEHVLHLQGEIEAEFSLRGFVTAKARPETERWKLALEKYDFTYEILAWHLRGDQRLRYKWRMPNRHFEEAETIQFYGTLYPCFGPIEDYLEWHYGDWKTPKRTADKEAYNAPEFWAPPRIDGQSQKWLRRFWAVGDSLRLAKLSRRSPRTQ